MKVRVGAATDIGQVREGNEDSFLVLEPLFAVADGVGGHRGGEVASELALQTIERLFAAGEGSLTEQVEEANRAVFERSQRDREVAGMGTTLTAAVVQGERARLAHVGDSRAYLFRDGRLHRLTEDHTLVHRMVQEGEITEEEAEVHPNRNIVTRALGMDPTVQVDEAMVDLRGGDRLLLCTDGLTGMVRDGQIEAVLAAAADPQEAVDRLVKDANRAGGVDNITAVLVDVTGDGSATGGVPSAPVARRPARSAPGPPRSTRTETFAIGGTPPGPGPGRRPWWRPSPRAAIWTGAVLAVLVLGLVAFRFYLDTQWFVGVSDGRVAVFRGVPAEVAGFRLHSVVSETSIPAEEAEALPVWRGLPDGITADDREGADEIVDQIRTDVAESRAVEVGSP